MSHIWVSSLLPGSPEHLDSRNSSVPTDLRTCSVSGIDISGVHEKYLFVSFIGVDDIIDGE
jgi:hypothetical protein